MPGHASLASRLDIARIDALIDARFPQIHAGGRSMLIESVGGRAARVRLQHSDRHNRPGGTISGPTMFTLTDFAIYVAIIAELGEPGLDAVTTSMNINFLAKPEPRDLLASVRLLRMGRRLTVAEVELTSDGASEMCTHAVATYALPALR